MPERPSLQPTTPRPGANRTSLLAAVLVGVIGVVALLLLLVPPTAGPIYTDLPPVDLPTGEGFGELLGLLPLSVAAVGLVFLGAFVIPILIRRLSAGQLDPTLAFAAAGRLSGRLRLVRFLPALRVASVIAGGLLTALSIAITVPELIGRLSDPAAPDPTIEPVPVDPSVPSGVIDPATLLAMVTGVVIFGGLLLLVLPSLKLRLRLPRRTASVTRPVVTDQAPSAFIANPELPPEIAALFPAPPRQPTRFDRFRERALPALRAFGVRLGALLVTLARGTVRLVTVTMRAAIRGGIALLAALRAMLSRTLRGLWHALRLVARGALQLAATVIRTTQLLLRLLLTYGAAATRKTGRLVVRLIELVGAGIILGLLVLSLLLLTLIDLAIRSVIAGGRAVVRMVTWLGRVTAIAARTTARVIVSVSRATVRGSVALVRAVGRSSVALARGVARGGGAIAGRVAQVGRRVGRRCAQLGDDLLERFEQLIDARRRPAEGGPMTTPVTVLVVALAPQSGKSTVAAEAARLLGTSWINSSAVIAERLEQRLGLPAGRIAETRTVDHEAYRPALIEEGNRMAAEGTSPGVECVRRGYRVIDGIRRREELEAAVAEVRARGGLPVVICVRRPHAPALADNTEAAALAALADVTIDNDGALSRLRRRTSAALRRYRVR